LSKNGKIATVYNDMMLMSKPGFPLSVLKFKDFSRTLKLHFDGLDGSLQHGQYYSNI